MSRLYRGERREDGVFVEVLNLKANGDVMQRSPLPLYLHVVNHSPTGFEWGYAGSGAARDRSTGAEQLAVAILTDCLGAVEAMEHHQAFKARFVAAFGKDWWEISESQIGFWHGCIHEIREEC